MKAKTSFFRIRTFGWLLIIVIFVLCTYTTTTDVFYTAITDVDLTKANGSKQIFKDKYDYLYITLNVLSFDWPVSDTSIWPKNTIRIYLNLLPTIGDSLVFSKIYLQDSAMREIGIYETANSYTAEKSIADTISAKFIRIPFNDSINVFESDTSRNKNEIKDKNAFSFSIQWRSNVLNGKVYWVKVTDTSTGSGGCIGSPMAHVM